MNSLVVLLSVVALGAAKPTGDIKSTPAIASTFLSGTPIGYNAIGAPITAAAIGPALLNTLTPTFAAPAIIKTAQIVPAIIEAPSVPLDTPEVAAARAGHLEAKAQSLVEAPVVPLDTPEVVAARAAHFEAKVQALADAHAIHKRSVQLASVYSVPLAAPVVSTYATAPVISSHLSYSTPIATPVVTKTYGIHAW